MDDSNLTVAVTGPTGEIGVSFIRALERTPGVGEIRGMARRPFDPASRGWEKTRYAQGDVLDREAIDRFVEGADVVVHLAFIIFGGREESRRINLEGSRNVFEATVAAGAKRLVYTSSVAAYGFHSDNPQPLTEDLAPRGTEDMYYSAQKAELEEALEECLAGSEIDAYVFRPCIVGGPESPALIENLPYIGPKMVVPPALRGLLDQIPVPAPVIFDTGVPLQLVHADDVATALVSAVLGDGPPGIYNLAAPGEITYAEIARELGWRSVPIPEAALTATAQAVRMLPLVPQKAEWVHVARIPVLMDTTKAENDLDWHPSHDAAETLRETIAGHKERHG